MEPLVRHTGIAAPMLRANIDTDAIIPSREMKRVSKRGLGEGLFAGERYLTPGGRDPNPEFVLNRSPYDAASILLGGANFGCGSSREHAVWALHEFGIRIIVAPGFGTIFAANCVRNGLLPLVLPEEDVRALARWVEQDPDAHRITVDLEARRVFGDGRSLGFDLDSASRRMLLEGLDPIALTLTREASIRRFHAERVRGRPWLYRTGGAGG